MITKASFDFEMGTEVQCQDGACGKLLKLVADPATKEITHLIVEKGFLLKQDRIIPLDRVERAGKEGVTLSLSSEELSEFETYQEYAYQMLESGWDGLGNYQEGDIMVYSPRVSPYGTVTGPYLPMLRHVEHRGVPEDETVVEKGTPVKNREESLGTVDHLLVDRETAQIKHLVVSPGPLDESVILPRSEVKEITAEAVVVDFTSDELEELPRYHPPSSAQILHKSEEVFEALAPDFQGVLSTIEDGVLELSGVVPDIGEKRQAEAAARRVEGVVSVENKLDTDTAIVARVTAALAEDPETELADIDVASERGIVTLVGKVDRGEVRRQAEKIVSQQRGVKEVINELVVEPDEHTPHLKSRDATHIVNPGTTPH